MPIGRLPSVGSLSPMFDNMSSSSDGNNETPTPPLVESEILKNMDRHRQGQLNVRYKKYKDEKDLLGTPNNMNWITKKLMVFDKYDKASSMISKFLMAKFLKQQNKQQNKASTIISTRISKFIMSKFLKSNKFKKKNKASTIISKFLVSKMDLMFMGTSFEQPLPEVEVRVTGTSDVMGVFTAE
jgi:hypothetical protein